jgi:hypothetical protein
MLVPLLLNLGNLLGSAAAVSLRLRNVAMRSGVLDVLDIGSGLGCFRDAPGARVHIESGLWHPGLVRNQTPLAPVLVGCPW